ncbi:MAG: carbon-nitrogen family hydrolase [Oscillospiraceae bacterium]|nr:carbon-nitrogen family hydrolase [Oscillospiraceae bacterium]
MKISCIQMDMQLGLPDENFGKAARLIEAAMAEAPDVIVLPETWNVGFFPKDALASLCDRDGARVRTELGTLAKKHGVNLVAGSVANLRGDKVYNTALVFDRGGACVAAYDKTHLFTPLGEDRFFTPGDHLCKFTLDGVPCGLIICYDIRFPELTRTMALSGMDLMFVVSQWPKVRISHLRALTTARAIENQMFLCCCNSCGTAGKTVYGGASAILDPWGETLALAGEGEEILSADCDFSIVTHIRETINVFADRKSGLYQL